MINTDKLKQIIEAYKADFTEHFEGERYKWEAVKCFQDNWKINADDFVGMLKKSFSKTGNLLATSYYYPFRMIWEFAKIVPQTVKEMFSDLFDETKNLSDRITKFLDSAEYIRKEYDPGTWKQHYQSIASISVYLTLKYPQNYYFYKNNIYKAAIELTDFSQPKGFSTIDKLLKYFEICDEVYQFIKTVNQLFDMVNEELSSNEYKDFSLHMVVQDILYYNLQKKQIKKLSDTASKIEASDESEIDNSQSSALNNEVVNSWLLTYNPERWDWDDFEDVVSMTKRGEGYHTDWNCSNQKAKDGDRVYMVKLGDNSTPKGIFATGYIISDFYEGENFDSSKSNKIKYVEILLTKVLDYRTENIITLDELNAKYPEQKWNPQGSGISIRPDAARWLIDNFDNYFKNDSFNSASTSVNPNAPVIWKISHGKERTGIPEKFRKPFEERNIVVVHSQTSSKGNSSISQGLSFTQEIKKGDYFYLCYSNEVVLFGQFIDDNANPNHDMSNGWYERNYKIIKRSKNHGTYKGINKWWTPNNNSTCIQVSDNKLFEELILDPYFGLTLADLNKAEYYESYTKGDFLSEVYITQEQYNTLIELIKRKKNIILQGAPGVGKTFTAKRLAYSLMGEKDDSRIEFIQFHQSYSYEDFIMGYRPNGNGIFELKDGVFYRFCDKARNDSERDYFFIIDEINRGNLSKIFGELLVLIEKDYRSENATLAYKDEKFSVPKNLYIIGMMNTADRSLAMIDYALRRRFSFFEMNPSFDSEGFKIYSDTLNNTTFNNLIGQIKLLNNDIEMDSSLGKGFCIGHSYFCNLTFETCNSDRLRSVVEYDILPMLKEYWFDEIDKVEKWSENLRGIFNDN